MQIVCRGEIVFLLVQCIFYFQEYKLRKAINLVKDEKSGLQFDFIEWIRLSKLR